MKRSWQEVVVCVYDYFYGAQAEQFSFIRIPSVLFRKEEFKNISPEAKVLYGILLKRMDLSAKNGWFDDQGRVYIIFTQEEIMETLNCGNQKAVKLMDELEGKIGLIERKRQGLGKPRETSKEASVWHFSTAQSVYCRLSSWHSVPVLVSGARSTCWKVTATITPARMLMYGKEASNRKQEIDRQHYTIPNQRPKDKHCGKI